MLIPKLLYPPQRQRDYEANAPSYTLPAGQEQQRENWHSGHYLPLSQRTHAQQLLCMQSLSDQYQKDALSSFPHRMRYRISKLFAQASHMLNGNRLCHGCRRTKGSMWASALNSRSLLVPADHQGNPEKPSDLQSYQGRTEHSSLQCLY